MDVKKELLLAELSALKLAELLVALMVSTMVDWTVEQ